MPKPVLRNNHTKDSRADIGRNFTDVEWGEFVFVQCSIMTSTLKEGRCLPRRFLLDVARGGYGMVWYGIVWYGRCLLRIPGGRSVRVQLRIGTMSLGRHCGHTCPHLPRRMLGAHGVQRNLTNGFECVCMCNCACITGAWWCGYSSFVLRYAKLAQESLAASNDDAAATTDNPTVLGGVHGGGTFVLGSELTQAFRAPALRKHWCDLATTVRTLMPGFAVTLAAEWYGIMHLLLVRAIGRLLSCVYVFLLLDLSLLDTKHVCATSVLQYPVCPVHV